MRRSPEPMDSIRERHGPGRICAPLRGHGAGGVLCLPSLAGRGRGGFLHLPLHLALRQRLERHCRGVHGPALRAWLERLCRGDCPAMRRAAKPLPCALRSRCPVSLLRLAIPMQRLPVDGRLRHASFHVILSAALCVLLRLLRWLLHPVAQHLRMLMRRRSSGGLVTAPGSSVANRHGSRRHSHGDPRATVAASVLLGTCWE
mmetsp:Transcript_100005/g.291689  ORF Transcript_100005/g.291689 Transcript_100005/m.291689 type:complete len:202 (+) Transcript_100005:1834-2439(+)